MSRWSLTAGVYGSVIAATSVYLLKLFVFVRVGCRPRLCLVACMAPLADAAATPWPARHVLAAAPAGGGATRCARTCAKSRVSFH